MTTLSLLVKLIRMPELSVWFLKLSDLFVNLSAGWYGAALILPISGKIPKKLNSWLLTQNVILGTLSLVISALFQKAGGP